MTLAWIDTETTGLDPRIHQPWEVCVWREDWPNPETYRLAHDLTHADTKALEINGYFERDGWVSITKREVTPGWLAQNLSGVTLVGANPAFDAAMLTRFIGTPVWHYRLIDVESMAIVVFDWDVPRGLATIAHECRLRGHDIPEPDHTAEADVRTTRAVYDALRAIRKAGVR